jgi:hypothetical protein
MNDSRPLNAPLLLIKLWNAVDSTDYEDIKTCIKKLNALSRYFPSAFFDWKYVYDYLELAGPPKGKWFCESLVIRKVGKGTKDPYTIFHLFELGFMPKKYPFDALCNLKRPDLLLELMEANKLTTCFRRSGELKTLFIPIFEVERPLGEKSKALAVRYFNLLNSQKLIVLGSSVKAHLTEAASEMTYYRRADALTFLAEHCEMFKYINQSRLLDDAIYHECFDGVKLILTKGDLKNLLKTKGMYDQEGNDQEKSRDIGPSSRKGLQAT